MPEGGMQGRSLLASMSSILAGLGSTGGRSHSRSVPHLSRLASTSSTTDNQLNPTTQASFNGGIRRASLSAVTVAGSLKPSISEGSLILAKQLQFSLGLEEQEV
jgi:hypothetical protein